MAKTYGSGKVRYGIVGCGDVFSKHAEAIKKNKESELIAVFDIDAKLTDGAAAKYGCETKPASAMFKDPNIDAVIICTPHDTHKDLILRTIEAGKYAICEKPLVTTLKDGREILRSKFYRQNVMTVFQTRFNPVARSFLRLVASGGLGEIRICNAQVCKFRENEYFKAGWRGNHKSSGGMLSSQGIHALDLLRLVCGDPKRIMAIGKNYRPGMKEVEDAFVASLEFKNGAVGTITISTAVRRNHHAHSIFVGGSKGSVEIGGHAFEGVSYAEPRDITRRFEVQSKDTDHAIFLAAANDFILRGIRHPLLPFAEDGVLTMEFIDKLYAAGNKKC